MRWLPASATILLIAIGMYLATTIELPTINMKWGDDQQLSTASVFSQSGLKSIKCYGSSMSFASKVQRIKCVLGVETFVQSHSVKVYYDSTKLQPEAIRKAIFTPTKTMLRKPGEEIQKIAVLNLGIEKLFDSYDNFYLTRVLAQTEGIYGFSTEFGEPVPAKIYFDPMRLSIEQIKSAIEQPTLTYSSQGKENTVDLQFGAEVLTDSTSEITPKEFVLSMFPAFSQSFNGYKKYKAEDLEVYQLPMPQATNPRFRRSMAYLVSHISTDDNVVRFETAYEDQPVARIYYLKGQVYPDSIYAALQKSMLTVHYRNGKTGQMKNPFKFPQKGTVLE